MKQVFGVVAGYAVWTAIFLGVGAAVRSVLGGTAGGGGAPEFSTLVLVLLLLVSFAASFAGGAVAARVAGPGRPVLILAGLLLATGIPVQIGSWALLPVWYHLIFLAMLVPVTLAGGRAPATP